ncbi:hypothetical protein MMC07_002777 [Pseudocyphellaria aurata]|nr:hypothetical protein [Pseudocyphellaria aurata]
MRQCLTSPDGGYYTSRTQGRDQFGQKGDFVTSPEISQVFGELLGIWMVAEWMAQGKVSHGVEMIEVGPGRGTLMDDMLRTISSFKALASSIEQIYLVEASPSLRDSQRKLLCGDAPVEQVEIGLRSKSKYSGLPITWCEDIRFVPNGKIPQQPPFFKTAFAERHIFLADPSKTPFIFAHEFFDALPIHAFKSVVPPLSPLTTPTGPLPTKPVPQWRELVVTPTPPPSHIPSTPMSSSTPSPDFQLSVSKTATPSSRLLPNLSPRYSTLLKHPSALIEICPDAHTYAANFAHRIGGGGAAHSASTTKSSSSAPTKPHPSGAALILDYGPPETVPTSTLRGIQGHRLVSPLSQPGRVDISADVDFAALAHAALAASPGVEVHGPVEQGGWLERMGIRERGEMLCRSAATEGSPGSPAPATSASPATPATPAPGNSAPGPASHHQERTRTRISSAISRLVERGGGGMGRIYKVLAIVPERGGRRPPVGFGGDVVVG